MSKHYLATATKVNNGNSSKSSNIQMVKDLRAATGAPLGKIKDAIEKANGNFDAAVKLLGAEGVKQIKKIQSKSGKPECGLIGCTKVGGIASIAQLQCQTDFVAGTDQFKELLEDITLLNLSIPDGINRHRVELLQSKMVNNYDFDATSGSNSQQITVKEKMDKLMLKTGEIIFFEKILRLQTGFSTYYLHNPISFNKIETGVKVAYTQVLVNKNKIENEDKLNKTLRNVCIHILNCKPKWISIKDIPTSHLKVVCSIEREQVEKNGIAEGKDVYGKDKQYIDEQMLKWEQNYIEDKVLEEQDYIIDEKQKIKKILENHRKLNDVTLNHFGFMEISV